MNRYKKIYLLLALFFCNGANGQLNVLTTSNFYNKIQFNPSQAGLSKDLNFNITFKSPLDNSIDGLTKEFAFTTDMPISENAGIGLSIYSQAGGKLKQSLINFSYSYDVRIKDNLNCRLGIGAGFKNIRAESILSGNYVGDPNDPTIAAFNSIPPSAFTSFSFTLYTNKIELQTVLPNLTAGLQNKTLQTVDYVSLQAGLTYKMQLGDSKILGSGSEARFFGGIIQFKQSGTIITGGILLNRSNIVSGNLQYNTAGIITVGVGLPIKSLFQINYNYSIGGLYSKNIYGGSGASELHINYIIKKKKNG